MYQTIIASVITLAALVAPAAAQQQVDIRFDPGATSTTINGTIIGDEYIDYVLGARAGQTMVVSLAVTGTNGNGSAFFNIVPAGQDFPALFNGSSEGRRAEVVLPETDEWAIRVYLLGNDADTGATVGYAIDVDISSDRSSGSGSSNTERVEFASGTTGAELSGSLLPQESRRYVLGAGDGQFLYFRLAANGPGMTYVIYNPDGSVLLDETSADREYRGQLWQSGDHVVEVYNTANGAQSFNVIFGVD